MNNSKTKGGNSASPTSRESQLEAQIADLLRQAENHKRLQGVTIERDNGISTKGKAYDNLTVKGIKGMSWQGLQLKPATWFRLLELSGDITEAMELHYPEECANYQG